MELITVRDAEPADQAWLAELYADSRHEEVARFGWSPAATRAFLMQQFDAQQRGYRATHPEARCQVIEWSPGAAAAGTQRRCGRLWVDRSGAAVEVLDIRVWSAWRGRGIGGTCLREVLAQAQAAQRDVRLFVQAHNPARRLYERLGFAAVASQPPDVAMRWHCAGAAPTTPAEVCHEQA